MVRQNQHTVHLMGFALMGYCLCSLLLCSCGYRFGDQSGLPATYSTISVPYIEGDIDGLMTACVVKTIVRSGTFNYREFGGALLLKIRVLDVDDENIGFRYDRRKSGELRKSIIPTETRRTIYAEVVVENAATRCIILGPARLSASVDFDHDYQYARDEVNVFSLGQLSDIDQAIDAVQTPLNWILARKIVDYITQSW